MLKSAIGQIMQQAYVVDDVEMMAAKWANLVGAGPFYIRELMRLDDRRVRGIMTAVDLRVAVGYWGSIQIELIKPLTPDVVFRCASEFAPGAIHHCAAIVSDLDYLLTTWKLEDRVLQSARLANGLRLVYLDHYLPSGAHLELIEAQDATRTLLADMQAISRNWDGENPVRSISSLPGDLAKLKQA